MPVTPISILVVDDVPEMREMLQLILKGIQEVKSVATVGNVWEARLELSRRRPALVVLDEVLPGESSLDFLEELKKEGIPVILVTGMSERQGPLPQGAATRLYKPEGRHPEADRKRFREAILGVFNKP